MTTMEEILNSVIADWLDIDERDIFPEASFLEDLNADSLSLIELMMALEDEFHVTIPPEDMTKLETVQDASNYIEQQLKGKQRK